MDLDLPRLELALVSMLMILMFFDDEETLAVSCECEVFPFTKRSFIENV